MPAFHYRFIDTRVSFRCQVFDEKHQEIYFSPNPAEAKGAAIFRNHLASGHPMAPSCVIYDWSGRASR